MKLEFRHPPAPEGASAGARYWRSLDDLAGSPGFQSWLHREFPEDASTLEGVDRRSFLRLMAAGFAFAGVGLAGCRRPESRIVAYAKPPEQVVPGKPTFYATSYPAKDGAVPLVVETHEARPTKLEGNPTYAPYGGATDLRTQATVLDLYDPDRLQAHRRGGANLTTAQVQDVLAGLGSAHRADGGSGLAFLAEGSTSPTRARLVAEIRRAFPRALWVEHDAVDLEAHPAAGAAMVFGRPAKPVYRYGAASVIVSLEADFLGAEAGRIGATKGFADGRRLRRDRQSMNRLYVLESGMTMTGAAADHRLRVETAALPAFAAALAAKVFKLSRATGPLPEKIADLAGRQNLGAAEGWLQAVAEDLVAHAGKGILVAGGHVAPEVHALFLVVNQVLGNLPTRWTEGQVAPVEVRLLPERTAAPVSALVQALESGAVRTLVVLGGNPVYDAPGDVPLGALLAKAGEVVRWGYHDDETSRASGVVLAAAHYLESWGDARTVDGEWVPVQPMIEPLFGGLTEIEVLARILGTGPTDPYTLVYETFKDLARPADPEMAFQRCLHDGIWAGSGYRRASGVIDPVGAAKAMAAFSFAAPAPAKADDIEVRFAVDYKMEDGRFANNGWLQECPDPITRLAWDNAIQISPRLGAELGLIETPGPFQKTGLLQASVRTARFNRGKEEAPLATLTVGGATITGPLHVVPGLANYTVVVPLGYGRTVVGRVGEGSGFSAYPLRTSTEAWCRRGARLTLTGATRQLANTQEHWSYEGRDIYRETNLKTHAETPGWATDMGVESHTPPIYGWDKDLPLFRKAQSTPRGNSIYEKPDFAGEGANYPGTHQWGMSIDLTACTGCQACVVACQAENNIPYVGREQVIRGREMHWIRIDRYFTSGKNDPTHVPEDPQVALQPMTCVHCESAPCESVCPVNATVHDEEGLNVMAYNRCIGTRYCANNCPYKVRRFNFFDYHQRPLDRLYQGPLAPKGTAELLKLAKNPDVTVRMRGVMEKCTYCVQRIQQAKIDQKVKAGASDRIEIPDGTVRTACQQVCPAGAIVFGNIADPDSEVSRLKALEHDYAVLGYLNVRPRTTYLGRVRNPNTSESMRQALAALGLPDVTADALGRKEYKARAYPAGFHDHGGHGAPDHSTSTPGASGGGH